MREAPLQPLDLILQAISLRASSVCQQLRDCKLPMGSKQRST